MREQTFSEQNSNIGWFFLLVKTDKLVDAVTFADDLSGFLMNNNKYKCKQLFVVRFRDEF